MTQGQGGPCDLGELLSIMGTAALVHGAHPRYPGGKRNDWIDEYNKAIPKVSDKKRSFSGFFAVAGKGKIAAYGQFTTGLWPFGFMVIGKMRKSGRHGWGRKFIDFIRNVVIIVTTMRFEWDEKKNSENIRKHRLDFADAWQVFENPLLAKLDDRENYGEDRWIGVGIMSNGIVVVLIFTKKEQETIRIISMRKATKNERTRYEKAIKNRLGKD